jgi:hypothetical protein
LIRLLYFWAVESVCEECAGGVEVTKGPSFTQSVSTSSLSTTPHSRYSDPGAVVLNANGLAVHRFPVRLAAPCAVVRSCMLLSLFYQAISLFCTNNSLLIDTFPARKVPFRYANSLAPRLTLSPLFDWLHLVPSCGWLWLGRAIHLLTRRRLKIRPKIRQSPSSNDPKPR